MGRIHYESPASPGAFEKDAYAEDTFADFHFGFSTSREASDFVFGFMENDSLQDSSPTFPDHLLAL